MTVEFCILNCIIFSLRLLSPFTSVAIIKYPNKTTHVEEGEGYTPNLVYHWEELEAGTSNIWSHHTRGQEQREVAAYLLACLSSAPLLHYTNVGPLFWELCLPHCAESNPANLRQPPTDHPIRSWQSLSETAFKPNHHKQVLIQWVKQAWGHCVSKLSSNP